MNSNVATSARRNVWLISTVGVGLSIFGCECEGDRPPLTRLSAQIQVYDPSIDGKPEIMEIDFGAVPLGVPFLRAVGVRNIGDDQLRICIAGATDPNCTDPTRVQPESAPFTPQFDNLSETGVWVVDRGSEREFTLTFTPNEEGAINATLLISHNGSNGPTTVINLKGEGVQPRIDLSADALDFGQVTVDQRKELELVLTNGTQFAQPFTVDPLMQSARIFGVADAAGAEPAEGSPFRGTVPGNSSTTIKVWFQPVEEGPAMNMLNISYCETCAKQVSLRGEGIKPLFLLDPPSLDFGVSEEGTPVERSFVVRNIGNVPLTVFSTGPDRNTTTEFSATPAVPLPMVLNPTEELTVSVTYVGTTPGDDSGNIEVVTNAWDDPNTPISETVGLVALTATSRGPDINPFPPAVNFGTVAIMGTPATRILSVQNVGNAPLTVSSIALNVQTPEVTMDPPPATPLTIDPGASIDLRLHYAPQNAGMDSGEVVVISDDRDEGTLSIPLAGIGGVPTTCSLNVAPSQVTFGLVERGRTATLPVEIRNAGAQPCSVSNIRLSGAAEFAITVGGGNANIAPGATHRVDVQYAPTAYGMHSTLLEFDSDDPAQPSAQVPITGASEESTILVIPSQLDFNVVPVTCRSPNRAVTVYNTGASPVQINNVFLDPSTTPEFELTPFPTPQSIAAGGSAVINLRYHPIDIGPDTGVLFISHSANLNPVAVPLTGEGQISPTVTDRFQQLPNPQADVLFVVDNSCSMSEEQASLAGNLGQFLSFAQQQGIDYQIAVTTTDVDPGGEQGRFVERGGARIITPSTPNGNMIFQQNVSLGTGGSGYEQGLEAAYLALSDPLINTWNAGFLRNDAALAVIFVSDEVDSSPRAASFYENFLRNIKGFANSTLFSASAVVGTQNPYCVGPGGSADYAPSYINIANNTGGVVESICAANWGQTLANIGLNSFGLKRQFTLSSQPVPVTIAVKVDGAQVPSTNAGGMVNWTYDMATNSVVFSAAAVPQANSTIEITYTVACLP